MLSVDEIRTQLIKFGLSQEEAASIKGKNNLLNKLQELSGVKIDKDESDSVVSFDDLLEINSGEDVLAEEKEINNKSTDWHDYVMSFFDDSELVNKCPTVAGLRRVSQILVGKILNSRVIHYTFTVEHATCQYEVSFLKDGEITIFGGLASSNEGNTDEEFKKYLLATTETRAEGRALKKALFLNTIFAEEATSETVKKVSESKIVDWNPEDKITNTEKMLINTRCKMLNINIKKLLNSLGITIETDKLNRSQAGDIIKVINRYQTNNIEIPNELKETV